MMSDSFSELNKAYTKWVDPDSEQQWQDHYQRTYELMTTTCDRNLPLDQLLDSTDTEKKAAKQAAWDAYDERMMNYMSEPTPKANRSLRYNTGKADYSLIPMAAMKEAAHVLEYGATKYAIDNWMKPTNWRVSYACLMRHMSAWQSGEDLDPESERNHLGHAMCNILQMLYMLENHPEELER
jgi:hypothetical protein